MIMSNTLSKNSRALHLACVGLAKLGQEKQQEVA